MPARRSGGPGKKPQQNGAPDMALAWTDEPADLKPHPGLEAVSAWHFLRNNEFNERGAGDNRVQFAAIIESDWDDAARKLPAETFLAVNTRRHGKDVLTQRSIEEILQAAQVKLSSPRIFVLPLEGRSLPAKVRNEKAVLVDSPRADNLWRGDRPEAIVGIIDHGINIFHNRFRLSDRHSRVYYSWSQGGTFQDGSNAVPFGREWGQRDISKALRSHKNDEDALIRLLDTDFSVPGLHPLAFRTTHGTHVLDVAAGAEPGRDFGNKLPIIAVNLPPEVARETSGSLLGLFFLQGFGYILARARSLMRQLDQALPVAVNFSFGLSGGPRGGQHFVEQAIDALIVHHKQQLSDLKLVKEGQSTPPVDVILPAGNRNLAAGHVGVSCADALSATWQLQPADRTSNFMEIRVETEPGAPTPVIDLSLTPPSGGPALRTRLAPGSPARWLQDGEARIGRVVWHTREMKGGQPETDVHVLTLALAETEATGNSPFAEAGPWKLRVGVRGMVPRRIDAWTLRDDTPPGYRERGRQSYFIDPDYRERDKQGHLMPVDPAGADQGILRAGTLNAIATGAERRVVGGQIGEGAGRAGPVEPAPYSGNPLPNSPEQITDWAVCERSKVLPGILAAGTRSGTRVAVNGTSVATPQVLRGLLPISDDQAEATPLSGQPSR